MIRRRSSPAKMLWKAVLLLVVAWVGYGMLAQKKGPSETQAVSSAPKDNSVDYAYRLCNVIDGTGLTSAKCEVSGWNSSVTMHVDMSASEARKTCAAMVNEVRAQGLRFDPGWTIQIRSPYSGDNSIAFCNL